MVAKYYQVVGRKKPTEKYPEPQIFRMRLFAPNDVTAKSRFWYFLHKIANLKKTSGEILALNEIREPRVHNMKNFKIVLRYNSRSGTHNMAKEYRDLTLNGAVQQMYNELSGRHRARERSIQIIDAIEIGGLGSTDAAKPEPTRVDITQFLQSQEEGAEKVKFPIAHRVVRPSHKRYKTTFKARRPCTFVG